MKAAAYAQLDDVGLEPPVDGAEKIDPNPHPHWLVACYWEESDPPGEVWVHCQAEQQPEDALRVIAAGPPRGGASGIRPITQGHWANDSQPAILGNPASSNVSSSEKPMHDRPAPSKCRTRLGKVMPTSADLANDSKLVDLAMGLVRYIAGAVSAEAKRSADPDPYVPHTESPLGKRKTLALCGDGVFTTARKECRFWFIRRSEIDSYINSKTRTLSGNKACSDTAADVLREIGFEQG